MNMIATTFKKTLFAACLTGLAVTAGAQTEVAPYQPGVTPDGVTYYLPRTAFRVVATAEKTVYTPGEFNKYADRYLRLKGIEEEPYTCWTLKTLSVEPYGVPDKDKLYTIRLKNRTIAPLVDLTEEGILLSINTEGEEEVLPPLPQRTQPAKRLNPRDFMNQEMLATGTTAKMAELVAQEIYEIRESRNALVRGEADNTPKDGAQLKLMLDQLNVQETALLQLFKGVTETTTEVFELHFDPSAEMEKEVLFRFSKKLGWVDKDDLSGAPIYLSIQNQQALPEPVEDEKTAKKKAKMETGVFFNVPGRATICLSDAERTLFKGDYTLAQFGHVEVLSELLFNKKTDTRVTFYNTTGGVRHIEAAEP